MRLRRYTFFLPVAWLGVFLSGCTGLIHDDAFRRARASDVDAPPPPTAVSLYSDSWLGVHTTGTYIPDVEVYHEGNDSAAKDASVASGFSHFECRVLSANDGSEHQGWTSAVTEAKIEDPRARSFRSAVAEMLDGGSYLLEVRAVDFAGNASTGIKSNLFVIEDAGFEPFADQNLAPVESLGDQVLASALVTGATRSNPLSARDFLISGVVGWSAATGPRTILRGDRVIFEPGTRLHANGVSPVVADGGAGGSGGGGGSTASTGCYGGAAGSAGADGQAGTCFGPGIGGLGLGSAFTGGFFFGVGGDGQDGRAGPTDIYAGAGGVAGNSVGGGGGGCGGSACRGGGGGGGLVAIVANEISGAALIEANGGAGGGPSASQDYSGNGGGGVVFVAAGAYDGGLSLRVLGGGVGTRMETLDMRGPAQTGMSLLFQRNSDGSLTRRRVSEAWSQDGVAKTAGVLPIPIQALPDPATMTPLAWSGGAISTSAQSRVTPVLASRIDVSGSNSWNLADFPSFFVYVDEFNLSAGAVLDASGETPSSGHGGKGGSGGASGSGSSGSFASGGGDGLFGGSAHIYGGGLGTADLYRQDFFYGLGGAGGVSNLGVTTGGLGGNATGGGGGGDNGPTPASGGGGGGLIVLVANRLDGSGTLRARGGGGFNAGSRAGGGGGGGVIWVAARSYTGQITADVAGGVRAAAGSSGTAKIYQLLPDNTLVERSLAESW